MYMHACMCLGHVYIYTRPNIHDSRTSLVFFSSSNISIVSLASFSSLRMHVCKYVFDVYMMCIGLDSSMGLIQRPVHACVNVSVYEYMFVMNT
jgi:hypothetical protein